MNGKRIAGVTLITIIALFGFGAFMGMFYTNEPYERGVVTHLGEISEVTGPGFQFKIPFIQQVHTANLQIKRNDYPINIYTVDGQPIDALLTVNHRISSGDSKTLKKIFEEFGENFDYADRLLGKQAIDRVKSVIGQINVTALTNERDKVRVRALNAARDAAAPFNIDIVDLQLSNIEYSVNYVKKIEEAASAKADVERARQEARSATQKAEAIVTLAKADADKAIEKARGEAESKKLNAEAEAFRLLSVRKAEAEGIRQVGLAKATALVEQAKALSAAPGLIEFTKAEAMKNWNGQLPTTMIPGAAVPFMNIGSTLTK